MKTRSSDFLWSVIATVVGGLLLSAIAFAFAKAGGIIVELGRTELPAHVVIAYDDPAGCPDGWAPLDKSSGRFIVGAGGNYEFRSTGGEDSVQLHIEDMPQHHHPIMPSEWGFEVEGVGHRMRIAADDGRAVDDSTGAFTTDRIGGNQFHENRPPYLALHLCRKERPMNPAARKGVVD